MKISPPCLTSGKEADLESILVALLVREYEHT